MVGTESGGRSNWRLGAKREGEVEAECFRNEVGMRLHEEAIVARSQESSVISHQSSVISHQS